MSRNKEERKTTVAREAAKLLYYKIVEEYKQAKEEAARTLGINVLPSNFEVALELDNVAEAMEGDSRKDLLIRLRRQALDVMADLKVFHPRLIGSVWRGTARKGSDIDITIYSNDPEIALNVIRAKFNVSKTGYTFRTEGGETEKFFHVFVSLPSGDKVELTIRNLEEMKKRNRCDIFGDVIKGLTTSQLQQVLERDALQKFIPKITK
ncbi:MAG: uncharacterized protein QG670_1409 [Thermoproteota archaeon]|nr:uncharacterized protein [Thermoproteota archaeon]